MRIFRVFGLKGSSGKLWAVELQESFYEANARRLPRISKA
ncbi:hypothetical protein KYC_12403 [Achromobacter arsenitoxydans SY8]|uniref:Uncharacterized protein n=1 Tax=Achromobacter arsenitoxydans SY8 TaxID=477184 RepID=H0F714_9BURK|nr:hypothetical protein KYC_12403 [Achromobacter arsenitoxydans SY8]